MLNFRLILGTIGFILIACNVPFLYILTPIFSLILSLIFRIPVYQDVMTGYSLFVLNMAVGLMLYIIGRKEFSNRWRAIKISVFKDFLEFRLSLLLTLFGLILIMDSLAVLCLAAAVTSYNGWGPPPLRTTREGIVFSLLLAWGGLTFLSGALWLVDGAKMAEDMVGIPPLEQEIDLKSQTKYPKDLLAKYIKKYPHNPTGVLEWHIDKKMKTGKTIEQAIKELTEETNNLI